jgi:hypothetical protein
MKLFRSLSAATATVLAPAFVALAALAPAPAAAETLTCNTISSLPTTISLPGHYCLHQNFSAAYATPAIVINASNVVLDCNDHYVNNTSGSVTGIYAVNRQNVTVRNCGITNFSRGIAFFETVAAGSRANLITGNRILRARLAAIQVGGTANIVEHNRISDQLGGSASYSYGVLVTSFDGNGVANIIRNNAITHWAPSLYVRPVAIYFNDVDNNVVAHNTISGLFPPLDMTADGIVASPTVLGTAAVGNTVLAVTGNPPGGGGGINYGGGSISGIRFEAVPDATRRNVCRFNVVGHWTSNITAESGTGGCVKDGNTEF